MDLVGKKFGRLTVIAKVKRKKIINNIGFANAIVVIQILYQLGKVI